MKYDLDLSEAYVDELDNIKVSSLDDEQMKTFLFDCFCDNDTIAEIWESIQENYFRSSPYNVWKSIDFDSCWLDSSYWEDNYPEIYIYINDSITLEVNVNVFFEVDWDVNEGDYDSYCVHDYTASVIHIENIKRV